MILYALYVIKLIKLRRQNVNQKHLEHINQIITKIILSMTQQGKHKGVKVS